LLLLIHKTTALLKKHFLIVFVLALLACKQSEVKVAVESSKTSSTTITYAKGFGITLQEDYTQVEVSKAFPDAEKTFTYILIPRTLSRKRKQQLKQLPGDAHIEIPIQKTVVTSTTHIPSLEMLGVENTLVGFPNCDYISSTKTRALVENGSVKELGQNESLNTEIALELSPDVVIGFGVDGQNKSLNSLQKAGIPVVYNGDWVEEAPLGKAEWIKFFGAFYDLQPKADSLFSEIAAEYEKVQRLASNVTNKPTVLSGGMFKDIWYLPKGNSWPAKLIADAGGHYLWNHTEGKGSLSLSVESVLDKGQTADFWIAPGQFTSYATMKERNQLYASFDAFKNKKVYTFAKKKGATGGLLYYELAPNRPDLVLKDMVYYLHPDLLPEYQPFFFTPLDD